MMTKRTNILALAALPYLTPLSHRPKQGANFAWGQQSGAWGRAGNANLLGVWLSLRLSSLRKRPFQTILSCVLILTNQIAQFIITSFPDFPIFWIFGFRNRIPQVGFLVVCLRFAWGLLGV